MSSFAVEPIYSDGGGDDDNNNNDNDNNSDDDDDDNNADVDDGAFIVWKLL